VLVRRLFILLALVLVAGCAPSSPHTDRNLAVTGEVIKQLRAMRDEPKFLDLPGAPAQAERSRLEPLINDLLERLIQQLPTNPSKSGVIMAIEPTVKGFYLEDTEPRERCVAYLQRILAIIGIQNTGCAFAKYLILI
jgi:uncharacterized protein DUF4844